MIRTDSSLDRSSFGNGADQFQFGIDAYSEEIIEKKNLYVQILTTKFEPTDKTWRIS